MLVVKGKDFAQMDKSSKSESLLWKFTDRNCYKLRVGYPIMKKVYCLVNANFWSTFHNSTLEDKESLVGKD